MSFKNNIILIALFSLILMLSFSCVSAQDDNQTMDAGENTNLTAGNTIYISPDGTGDGLSESSPTNWNNALNKASNGDTIQFSDGNYTNIGGTVYNINLKGSENTILDAQGAGGFFTTSGSVTLEKISFVNAYTGEKQGNPDGPKTGYDGEGAIINNGYLTVKNCYFANNQGIGTEGGAIHNSGTAYVYDSLFYANGGKKGGAIYSDKNSYLYVYNSVVNHCVSREGSAVHAKEATVEIHNCTVANSSAKNGLFYIKESYVKFYDSYFYNSRAVDSAGVINIDKKSNVEVYNCKFDRISSTGTKLWFHDEYGSGDGGVIVIEEEARNVVIKDSVFTNCSAKGYGGVLYIQSSSSVTIDNCTFKSNTAAHGNNIYSKYTTRLTIQNSIFEVQTAIDTEDIDYGETEYIKITYDDGTNGLLNPKYTVNVDNVNYTLSTSSVSISNLNVGNYTATLKATDYNSNNYILTQNSSFFLVGGEDLEVTATYSFNSDGSLNINIVDEYQRPLKNTQIKVNIDGDNYTATTNENGVAVLAVNLKAGQYNISLAIDGKIISENTASQIVVVNDTEIPITDEITVTFSYNDNGTVNVEVKDQYNRIVPDINILITINGITYNLTTDDKGMCLLTPVRTSAGEYSVEISAAGKTISNTSQKTIKIMPTNTTSSIIAENMIRAQGSAYDFKARLLDKNANPLKNKQITFIINGNDYLALSDEYGNVYLRNILSEGEYEVTVENPATNEKVKRNITIVSRISGNNDITMDYSYSKTYKIQIYSDNGEKAKSGEEVLITLNGKTATVKTDSNGVASYKVSNLLPKTYTITATYKNTTVSNSVIVKQILKAQNKIYKRLKTKKYTATLKTSSGKAIKNKKITFKINKKTYTAKTNKKGVASINIKALSKVGKYKITISYLKTSIKKTITIKK